MNTIVAISTATGAGGIGIVRMSGKECFSILEKIFEPKRKEKIDNSIIEYSQKWSGHSSDNDKIKAIYKNLIKIKKYCAIITLMSQRSILSLYKTFIKESAISLKC